MKNRWKMYQKSIKNQSKMDQTCTKNGPKFSQNWGLEGSRAGLEASWAVLGAPKDSWRDLGSSWRRHGSVLGGKSGQPGSNLAPSWRPKREAKSVLGRPGGLLGVSWRRHVADFMHFWCIFAACLKKYAFEADFVWIWTEKMLHGTNKISQIILRK